MYSCGKEIKIYSATEVDIHNENIHLVFHLPFAQENSYYLIGNILSRFNSTCCYGMSFITTILTNQEEYSRDIKQDFYNDQIRLHENAECISFDNFIGSDILWAV